MDGCGSCRGQITRTGTGGASFNGRKTTPAPASVWDAAPDVKQAEKLLDETRERLQALPPAPSPEEARQAVIDAAVNAQRTDGAPIPADIGERAAERTQRLSPRTRSVWRCTRQ